MVRSKDELVSILMVIRNNSESIRECVKSILNLTYTNFELIILDNNSSDNSIQILNEFNDPRIKIISVKKNLGYACGNNYCYKFSRGNWLLVVNPDVIVDKNLLTELLLNFKLLSEKINSDKIIISPKILLLDEKINYFGGNINFLGFSTTHGFGKEDIFKKSCVKTDFFSGCCFLIKKEDFKMLKGFDSNYFMYHEDVDLSLRARINDYHLYVINSTKIKHMKYVEDFQLNNLKYYLVERNRFITLIKISPFLPYTILSLILFEPILMIQALLSNKLKMRALIYVDFLKNAKKYIFQKKEKNRVILNHKIDFTGISNFIESRKTSLIIKILNSYAKILFKLFWERFYIKK
ncbi:MAG: glycosyltransferase [Candidatus Lokiarchaeota archaeon]|nr:glycosyltransferase [Candidatus Lokiarchaeota archaeon]